MWEAVSLVLGVAGLVVSLAALPSIARRLERRTALRRLERQAIRDAPPASMSAVDRLCRDRLFYHLDGWVRAVRLVGAESELIPLDRLRLTYTDTPLTVPPELQADCDRVVRERLAAASTDGTIFFNGPNTRLLSWRMSPSDGHQVGREDNVLHLRLGPVGWYDFEGLNGAFRAHPHDERPEHLYDYYVGLSSLVSDGSVQHSKLSNILDNAITIVTMDGYVGFQRRSGRVSLRGGALTSTVAENTNRYLDDTPPDDPQRPYRRGDRAGSAPSDYTPRGVPHPVAAALRGIASEISPEVQARVNPSNLYVTGISFDLEGLHPTLLFAAFVDLSHVDVISARRRRPGPEHIEGSLGFVPADLEHPDTRALLREPNWIPSGQASLIRAIEVVRALAGERRSHPLRVISQLRLGDPTG